MSVARLEPPPVSRSTPRHGPGVGPVLGHLDDAIAAARILELDTGDAEAVRTSVQDRLGFPDDTYVLALVGGTGVGKSSLLNALAGRTITTVGARRPTTSRPVAWLPESGLATLAPLLDRLGVTERHAHPGSAGPVAVLDLPDVDSVEDAHREQVEAILPLVDAVAWVVDPEKYADAVVTDGFLARWLPRLDRQLIVLNRIDRLPESGRRKVRDDLARVIARAVPERRGGPVSIVVTSAIAGPSGVEELRDWLARAADGKSIVGARIVQAATAAIDALAESAGAATSGPPSRFLEVEPRRRAVDAAVEEALRLVDVAELRRQAIAATRAGARRHGAGPLGRVTSLVYRVSGREARAASPGAHLSRWRDRGTLDRPAEPIRAALTEVLPSVPPPVRGAVAAAADAVSLGTAIGAAVDSVVAHQADARAPVSRLWPLFGIASTVVILGLVFAVTWTIAWVLVRPPVDMVAFPVIGQVPMPLAFLVGLLVIGFVIARLLGWHAGFVGRRWADRVERQLRAEVEDAISRVGFGSVDRLDAARRALWIATRREAEPGRRAGRASRWLGGRLPGRTRTGDGSTR